MLVTLSGIVMEVRLEHHLNASEPILVTGYPSIVDGMVTLVADVEQSIMDTSPSEIVYERSP